MMMKTILAISALLYPAGLLLLLFLWWPHRKTRLLSSVPWICLFLIYWSLSHYWIEPIGANFGEAMKSPTAQNAGAIIYICMVWNAVLSAIPFFLISAMAVINSAFILQSTVSLNRFQTALANQHRFQPLLGVFLLASAIAPTFVMLYTIHLLGR